MRDVEELRRKVRRELVSALNRLGTRDGLGLLVCVDLS